MTLEGPFYTHTFCVLEIYCLQGHRKDKPCSLTQPTPFLDPGAFCLCWGFASKTRRKFSSRAQVIKTSYMIDIWHDRIWSRRIFLKRLEGEELAGLRPQWELTSWRRHIDLIDLTTQLLPSSSWHPQVHRPRHGDTSMTHQDITWHVVTPDRLHWTYIEYT